MVNLYITNWRWTYRRPDEATGTPMNIPNADPILTQFVSDVFDHPDRYGLPSDFLGVNNCRREGENLYLSVSGLRRIFDVDGNSSISRQDMETRFNQFVQSHPSFYREAQDSLGNIPYFVFSPPPQLHQDFQNSRFFSQLSSFIRRISALEISDRTSILRPPVCATDCSHESEMTNRYGDVIAVGGTYNIRERYFPYWSQPDRTQTQQMMVRRFGQAVGYLNTRGPMTVLFLHQEGAQAYAFCGGHYAHVDRGSWVPIDQLLNVRTHDADVRDENGRIGQPRESINNVNHLPIFLGGAYFFRGAHQDDLGVYLVDSFRILYQEDRRNIFYPPEEIYTTRVHGFLQTPQGLVPRDISPDELSEIPASFPRR